MLPGLAWLAWFMHKDRYEPEPRGLIALAFVLGMFAFVVSRFLEDHTDSLLALALGRATLPHWAHLAFLVAPFEELAKAAVVRFRFYPDPEFNEPVDGIVYATSVAVGFATLENALYMQAAGRSVLVLRALSSTLMHVGCSGLIGHILGRQKFARGRGTRRVMLTLAGSIALHAGFDLLVTYGPGEAGPLRATVMLAALAAFLIGLFSRLDLEIEHELARSPFRPKSAQSATIAPPEGGRP